MMQNGAKFNKIQWPSYGTKTGIRGAIAIEDIETNEVMLEIPINLMLGEPQIFDDSVIGAIIKENENFLKGDLILIVAIMNEVLKGSKSFYYPYFQIFSQSNSTIEWTDAELAELQDDVMIMKSQQKKSYLMKQYENLVNNFFRKYPDIFMKNLDGSETVFQLPTDDNFINHDSYDNNNFTNFSYGLYKFAWHVVMSRAFGKRLPFSALVPFADCLNHNNLATKYDYNVNGNGLFRMYPTNSNKYKKGKFIIIIYHKYAI